MNGSDYRVYRYRWAILASFMSINLAMQMLWICFASITGPAASFYGVTDLQIGFLAMSFMIVYIPLSIPASWVIDTYGFRIGVSIGAALMGLFALLRGVYAADFRLVLIFTIGIALGQPFLLNAFTKVAARWFSINERATATGLAMVANYVGTAVGLILTPYLVIAYGIGSTQMIYGIAAFVSALIFIAVAQEHPPTPPCPEGLDERSLMFDGLKQILRRTDFWMLMFIFFVGIGIFNGIATWIESILRPRGFSITEAGLMGGLLLIGGIVGAIIIPTLSDKTMKRKVFMLGGMILAVPGMLGIALLQSYWPMVVSVFALGFFMMGIGPIGYQYAAEITYPAPEGTSNGLLVLAGQVSVVFIYGMEALKGPDGSFTASLLLLTGLLVINCVLIARLKESSVPGCGPGA